MNDQYPDTPAMNVSWWQPTLFAALAGGMGWGIRGQYGHETGAMIAGVLVSLTLVFLFAPRWRSLDAARAVALGTIAMGIGGSMTYGQTLGLTHDAPLIGNLDALRWGLTGTAVKGGLWIGFAGLFLGMGLGGVRYRSRELLGLTLLLVVMFILGVYVLNMPFKPSEKLLPRIYFSDHWKWEPGTELKPRFECWGGLLFAHATATIYAAFRRKDRLARNLAIWGMIGGAMGFSGGQSVQAFRRWNPEVFTQGIWENLDPYMNWWNMMETTFGTIMGAILGLGLWFNRRHIKQPDETTFKPLPIEAECGVLLYHLVLLYAVEFLSIDIIDLFYDFGVVMIILPLVGVIGGRLWPYLLPLVVTLFPIAGKTVRQLLYGEWAISPEAGWGFYFILPLGLGLIAALWFARKARDGQTAIAFTRFSLLLCTWTYFFLNYAFFHFPFPWAKWTGRTPNGILFTISAVGLTLLACTAHRGIKGERAPLGEE